MILFWWALLASAPSAGPVAGASQREVALVEECDPSFVLRISFRVAKPGGEAALLLRGPGGQGAYRLALSGPEIRLEEEGGARRRLARSAVRYAGANELLVVRRESLLRVALNGEIRLERDDVRLPIAHVMLADPERRIDLLDEARYQPTEEILLTDDFMTTPDAPSRWDGVAGTWHVAGVSNPRAASDPFKFIGFASREGMALSSESYWFWNDYRVAVSSRLLGATSGMGLVFGHREKGSVYGFSWGGPGAAKGRANRLRLWRREGGRVTLLAERPAYARVGQWYRLSVETRGAHITAHVDENVVLTARDPRLLGGQCGLYVEGSAGAEFDDWTVGASDAPEIVPTALEESAATTLDREFAQDPLMSAWGSVNSDWESLSQGGRRWYWHRTILFDAASVELNLMDGKGLPAPSEVVLMGESESPATGYRLLLDSGNLTLYRGATPVKKAAVAGKPARIEVNAGRVRVLGAPGDGEGELACLLEYADSKPLARGRVGVRFARWVSPEAVARMARVASPRMAEYRFDAAPIDWGIEAGEWIATTRWACVPHWNFFGGRGDPMSTLWNKRRFGGDQWIEVFAAPREGTSDRMHFTAPINLNLSFCAEGEQIGSGYSLVYRSHDEPALLYRRGKLVAENREIVLPQWRNDQMFVYYRVTQTWHHFVILREGGRIRVWVEVPSHGRGRLERRLLFDYTDPDPLPGDRLALWTWGENGMAVARVRVCAARRGDPVASFLQAPPSPTAAGGERVSVNPINGGWFRTDLGRWVDPGSKPVVIFDFQADSRATLALYAVAGGQRFRARFLGDVTEDGDSVPMGSARLTKLAGGWTRAEFPLRQALRTFFPSGKLPLVDQLFLASLSTRPELIAGLAANPKGCVFRWRRVSQGASSRFASAFRLATPKGEEVPAGDLHIAVADTQLDPEACAVVVNGRRLRLGTPGLRWDGIRGEFVVNLTAAGFRFRDGEQVSLKATAPGQDPLSLAWRMRVGTDKVPPTAPVVATPGGADRIDTFEQDVGTWRRLGGEQGGSLWRDETTQASGRFSLRLTHRRVAGSFATAVREKPFDARRWPRLTFWYRVRPEVQLSLVLEIDGKWYEIGFTDRDSTFPVIGAIAGVKADGTWRRADVDLAAAVRASGAPTTVISRLFFADTGWMNNIQGISWHVDDFRFVPALPAGANEALTLHADDLSGIVGYSWVFDNAAETVPDRTTESGPPLIPPGATMFHVRAYDGAGNWGPTTHFQFVPLDAGKHPAPEATPRIAAGGRIPAPAMEVALKNAGALDIESVRWWVRRGSLLKAYDLSSGGLRWNRAKGIVSWEDPALAMEKPAPLLCGLKACDLAGKMVLYREWRWMVDPALDRMPPAAPYVSYIPENRLSRVDFEHGVPPEVELRRSAWVFHETGDAAVGRGSARVVNLEADDFFSVFLRKTPYAVHDYPRVRFDYRFETAGCNLNIVSVVNGDLQTVGFAGQNGAYPPFVQSNIGRIEGVKQDGKWHAAEFDFGAFLRGRYPNTPRFFADYLGTWATGVRASYDNPRGASLWLDNITLYSPRATSAAFEWQPPADPNGVLGYSYVVDQKPETLPDEKIVTREPRCHLKNLKPGAWVFHVRACDGAGNWGPATHL
ncbi:MAG TPA: fibronectin type III domain-containing protein, partial [Armatimonadetes bacterium]|nr:fibronectin type III domain-containing protein [Armatimonadota bacterium]